MAVTKQNQQPAPSAMAQAMAEAMAQAQAQQQAQALAQAQAQESATDDQIADLIAVEKERAALLQQQLMQQMLNQMVQQMVQQSLTPQAPAPAAVTPAKATPELDQRLLAILAMCPYETREEARDWVQKILGCKPHEYVVTDESIEVATAKARAYLIKLSKKNKELKNELLLKETLEVLGGNPPKEYAPAQRVDSPAVYRPSSQPIVVSKPLFERPVRTYSPPQEVYVVRESQMRTSQSDDFWEDAIKVAAGVAVAGAVGYGIYKIVEHFFED